MPFVTIPGLAMVNFITDHAIKRYIERRQQSPYLIIADLMHARPLTKGRMRKLKTRRFSGHKFLRTPDGFLFIIERNKVVTCYYENTKVSTYAYRLTCQTTGPDRDPIGRTGRRNGTRRLLLNSLDAVE
ncbi:TPA: hypothetical protein ACG1DO_004117 [Kluyvera ascorbata]|uniref:hypothetical protein n=1 Tax=Kluyvera ascorbata TaxID=51288 RepID=UPI00289A82B9|nr:hypothetical protein [Kluyvera ascorbata]